MNDLDRLKATYKARELTDINKQRYSLFNPSHLFAIQQRQRDLIALLKQSGCEDLANKKILELGCGTGSVLLEMLTLGVKPASLFGVDLLFDRLQNAVKQLPTAGFGCADGQDLPYQSETFDVVMQFTAFSSVLDGVIRQKMADEMCRVLKPKGIIIWYDFWWNPINAETHGIQRAEIKALFHGYSFTIRKVTLAPPIARMIVPISWPLGYTLESLKIFNSHYLILMRKPF